MKNMCFIFIFFVIFNILINIIIYNFFLKPKRIVTIDIEDIIKQYILISYNDKPKNTKEFITKLNQLIIKVSKENNLIIFPKQAIFTGADFDITNEFKGILNEK